MAYTGKTYPYDCTKVGLNADPNVDAIPPESMVYPSRNVNLHNGGIQKRGGTSKFNPNNTVGATSVYGYDFILRNGNQFMLAGTSDGRIVTVGTGGVLSTLKSGLTNNATFNFSQMNNKAYVCNGVNRPQLWDGVAASTSDLSNIPSDWTGSSWPQQMVKHGRGNAEAMWAFGCASTPNTVYASKTNTGASDADFSDANVTLVYIETGDAFGIVGGIEFQGRLLAFGKRQAWVIDDTSVSRSLWGYEKAGWEYGGAASWRLIVKIPNDIVCMMEDGEIYSVTAVSAYGDYKQASLTRPSFMHKWIQDNVDLTKVNSFHAIYDPTIRAIKFFVIRSGNTKTTTALVYFIDKPANKAWAVHEGALNASGYCAASSWLRRDTVGTYNVYTGDYQGYVWQIETSAKNDDGAGYYGGIITPNLNFGDPRVTKFFDNMRCVTQSEGAYNLNMNFWVDGVLQNSSSVTFSLQGSGSALDTGTLGSFVLGGGQFIDVAAGMGVQGKRLQFELFNQNANQDFFISQALIDFRNVGSQP